MSINVGKFQGLFFVLSIITFDCQAADYWQCQAGDNTKQVWQSQSLYQLIALNKAYEQCKKNSLTPDACIAVKNTCQLMTTSQATKQIFWQCTALDDMAQSWISNSYSQRNDAALGAKAYCQAYSGSPDSCYINLLTCKNTSSL